MDNLTPLSSTEEAAQKIFDWFKSKDAVFGFENEGDETCVYRKDENPSSDVRCAFGCLIPDGIYAEAMSLIKDEDTPFGIERKLASEVLNRSIAMKMYFANVDESFIRDAQEIHDRHACRGDSMQHFLAEFVMMCWKQYGIDIRF